MSRLFDDGARTSRRRFVQILGASAAVAPLAGLLPAVAQPPPAATPPPATPPPAPAADAEVDPEIAAEAQNLTDIIQRRFGARLDAAQLQAIREDVQGNLQAGRVLRKLELGNADEPNVIFRAKPVEG